MEKTFRVVSVGERKTQEEADALVLKLAELGVNSQIRVDEQISELSQLTEDQIAKLGTINFLEFSDLMSQLGVEVARAKQLWGNLNHWTDLVSRSETPPYKVDTEAILAKAKPNSRASRRHFEGVAYWEQYIATTFLELPPVVEQIQSSKLLDEVGIGPVTVDSLTMLVNLRASQIAETEAQETIEQ
jgi:hypothetical protein